MYLIKNIILAFTVSLVISQVLSQDAQKRNNLLGKRPNFQKSTTSTTTPAAEYEDDYGEAVDESEYPEEEKEVVTTTTEAPKKRPIIRPFRSNEELLAALKKRRLNEKNKPATSKPVQEEKFKPEPEVKATKSKATTAAPAATSFNRSGGNNRRFGASKTNFAKPIIQEQQAQTIEEQPAARPSFRRPSRFALKNN